MTRKEWKHREKKRKKPFSWDDDWCEEWGDDDDNPGGTVILGLVCFVMYLIVLYHLFGY